MRPLSLRSRFLLLILGGVLLPLALVALWITRTATRSGEELLRARLEETLAAAVSRIGDDWVGLRSGLMTLSEATAAHLAANDDPVPGAAPPAVAVVYSGMAHNVVQVAAWDDRGEQLWSLRAAPPNRLAADGASSGSFPVALGVYGRIDGRRLGTIEARVRLAAIWPASGASAGAVGSVIAVFDGRSGALLNAIPFLDPSLLAGDRFRWRGEPWIALRRALHEPALEVVVAGPLTPYAQPFEGAARAGTLALLLVAALAFGLATVLTRRMTRSLEALAVAAEAVSRGELDRQVAATGPDEVGRVAQAFNSMTESLRLTLRELSQRQALAALGRFATSLAHEVRNPLSAIRIDLQFLQERWGDDPGARGPLTRVLGEVERLDRSVGGVLRLARSGRLEPRPVDVREPLQAAAHAATPEFEKRDAALELDLPSRPITLSGDRDALEQLFLNLMLNAAQALAPGALARVVVTEREREIVVEVVDTGRGLSAEERERMFEPFFSTRPDGTGLGLPTARHIAQEHGGDIEVESAAGAGTTVRVRLPVGP